MIENCVRCPQITRSYVFTTNRLPPCLSHRIPPSLSFDVVLNYCFIPIARSLRLTPSPPMPYPCNIVSQYKNPLIQMLYTAWGIIHPLSFSDLAVEVFGKYVHKPILSMCTFATCDMTLSTLILLFSKSLHRGSKRSTQKGYVQIK